MPRQTDYCADRLLAARNGQVNRQNNSSGVNSGRVECLLLSLEALQVASKGFEHVPYSEMPVAKASGIHQIWQQ